MRHRILLSLLVSSSLFGLATPRTSFAEPPRPEQSRSAPTRLRIGLELGAGPVFGDTQGAGFGLVGQLGLQLGDVVALFYQPMLGVYGWSASDEVEVFAFGSHVAMIDFTIGRMLQLGVGAGVDHGRFGFCSGGAGTCSYEDGQVQLGTDARVALVIPLPGIRARWGIPIAGHFHVTWFENTQIMAAIVTVGLMRY
jgi:hypothetical protein